MRKKSVGNTNDHSKTSRQTAYQRGSQREGSPHYVFLYSDDEGSGSEEDIPLESVRSSKAPPRKVEVIKVLLKQEDTLQALALRYCCTISELKRINNIHKENEIFAHRYIKVPVQPFSVITENLIDYEGASTSNENGVQSEQQPSTSREEQLINLIATPIVPPTVTSSTGINDIILNSVCEPLNKFDHCESTSITQNTETEQLISSNEREISSTPKSNTIDSFVCSGADWGLSWAHLLGFSLFLGFGGPLVFFFRHHIARLYVTEENHDENLP